MKDDVIFRIASMSKPITAAAALKLYEDGYFLLDDPVKKFIPQFGDLKVMENIGTDSAQIVDLKRDVTIRDLFRHTGGFGYASQPSKNNDAIDNMYVSANLKSLDQTPEDFINKICKIPLKYHPGSKWRYSYSNDLLGFLIEAITGKTLHEYVKESILEPLNMSSSGYYVTEENIQRLSSFYNYENDELQLVEDNKNTPYSSKPTICMGGAKMVSTAQDYANFCSMLLNYGKFNGNQVFQKQTVELLISDQIDNIKDRGFKVSGYGFGVGVSKEKDNGKTESINWSGSPFNTTFFVDYNTKTIAILLTQNAPWGHLNVKYKFASIVKKNIN
jgi:CubicO group peptidase (beta-lactamase class C family)